MPAIDNPFSGKRYDVEHAIDMYAYSFVVMPAFGIYDNDIIAKYTDQVRNCHIYMIGFLPAINLVDVKMVDRILVVTFTVAGKSYNLKWNVPAELELAGNPELGWHLVNAEGKKFFPTDDNMMAELRKRHPMNFQVLYIGQAYGDDGSRNALDRLKKHETLQKIALKGIPDGFTLQLLLLEVFPNNRLITIFNPFAKETDNSDTRIRHGLDKLYDANEPERITLYEASLIRYFMPQFNKEFKNSFPSTNMKLLSDCYLKDIAAVTAEICFDDLPFDLCSENIEPKLYHIAHHDLHKEEDRHVFFTGKDMPNSGSAN